MVSWSNPMQLLSLYIDNDYVDRLHHFLTSLILIICILASSKRQYFGSPISCWTPKIFTRAHIEYAEDICWVKNTYFLAMEDRVPLDPAKRGQTQVVGYYQWVPFVLLAQIVLFQFPNFVWTTMHDKSGFRLRNIVESANLEQLEPNTRKGVVRSIAVHIADYILLRLEGRMETRFQKAKAFVARYVPLVCSRNEGNFLCAFYLFSKLLYLANLLAQLFFMTVFLGGGWSPFYGFSVLANLTMGRYWQQSGQFPRVTLCDFSIRVMGNLHRHTLQCVLPINRINEKIFLMLWFWFFTLGIVTVWNLIRWTGRLYSRRIRFHFIRQMLNYVGGQAENQQDVRFVMDDWMIDGFLDQYLLMDGILILHLVAHNAGQLITAEIVTELWGFYEKEARKSANGNITYRISLPEDVEDECPDGVYSMPVNLSNLPNRSVVNETVPRRRSPSNHPMTVLDDKSPSTAIL